MTWAEIRNAFLDQWLVIEALEAVTAADNRRELHQIAIIERCKDGNAAFQSCRQWARRLPEREIYFVHTSQEIPPIYIDPRLRISPRPDWKQLN